MPGPTKQPDLPLPAHEDKDSMLSRKFGREIANYFSGSPLNRVGFLRGDNAFLSQALKHPSTSFLLANELAPLIKDKSRLHFVKYDDVKPLIGENPYADTEEEMIAQYNSSKSVPQMIFLGIDEKAKDGLTYQGKNKYTGAPYFAVDVTPRSTVADACTALIKRLEDQGVGFAKGPGGRVMELQADDGERYQPFLSPTQFGRLAFRKGDQITYTDVSASEAAMYAEARQMLDWNARNPFCAQCGQPTLSVNAGFKRTCPPTGMPYMLSKFTLFINMLFSVGLNSSLIK